MCVIMVLQEKFPSLDALEIAEEKNPDGAGVAWSDGDKVHWIKGLTAKQVYAMKDQISYPCFIHFRESTGSDAKEYEFNHPFPVTSKVEIDLEGDADKVLAHEGVWAGFKDVVMNYCHKDAPLYEGKASDTRAITWLYNHLGDEFLELLHQRVVTLDSKGNFKLFGTGWLEKDTMILSNNPVKGSHYSTLKWEDSWVDD